MTGVVTALAVRGLMLPSSAPPPIKRFVVPLPPEVVLPPNTGSLLALSPDGTKIAFVGAREGERHLFLQTLDDGETRVLPGTEGARHRSPKPDQI